MLDLFLPDIERRGIWLDYEIAEKLGINHAIILGRIIWWIKKHIAENEKDFFREGRWWMYESIPSFQKYSTLGRDTVIRTLKQLRETKILLTAQFDKSQGNNYNFYAVDEGVLSAALSKGGGLVAKPDEGGVSSKTILRGGLVAKPDEGQLQNHTNLSSKTILTLVAKPDCLSYMLSKKRTKTLTKKTHTPSTPPPPSSKKLKTYKHTAEDLELAKPWLDYAIAESSYTDSTRPKTWTQKDFAEGIYAIRTSAQYQGNPLNHFGMESVFKFIQSSSFWKKVAWSPKGLLKKNDEKVRKIDTILRQMKPESLRQEEKMKTWEEPTDYDLNNLFK